MKPTKRKYLASKGWRIGTAREFLKLSPEEASYVELKLTLSRNLQSARKNNHLTQQELARLLRSSQSRIAKMEAGDPSVSLDLLVRSLLALGVTTRNIAKQIADSR